MLVSLLFASIGLAAIGSFAGLAGSDDWIPIDDPDLVRLPRALRLLPHTSRAAFESKKSPWFLLARRVSDKGGFEGAFAADEKVLSKQGKFIPVGEEYLKIRGVEALFLECEWEKGESSMKASGFYAPASDGELTVLWLAAPSNVSSKQMLTELKSCFRRLRKSFEPTETDVYESLLNGHKVSFKLRSGRGRDSVTLRPTIDVAPTDRAFFDKHIAGKKRFAAGITRNWLDEDRGVSLSMQIVRTQTSLAPKDTFILWLAGQLQLFVRKNKDEGDAPVEMIHLEDARTMVISQEELDHHYANNRRAPDPGVILRTFLPRSPYARACRMRFTEKDGSKPSLAMLIELRDYPRSRSETVARSCILMFLVRAPEAANLERFEQEFAFQSAPLTEAAPLADLPR